MIRRVTLPSLLLGAVALSVLPSAAWSQASKRLAGPASSEAVIEQARRTATPRLPQLKSWTPPAITAAKAFGETPDGGEPKLQPGAPGENKPDLRKSGGLSEGGPAARTAGIDPVAPMNYGKGNQNTIFHYTDATVDSSVSTAYPYSAAGYFYYKASNNKWYSCSGALISNSIMLTAGHCVHDGGNGNKGWIKEGYFYPAYRGNDEPYGRASADFLFTTDNWFSKGKLGKGYDVGLVVLSDRQGKNKEIGSYTGYLGFCYEDCLKNYWFLTQLGWANNYSNGNRLIAGQTITDSEVGLGDRLGAVALGTAQTVGSAASIAVSTPIAVFDPVTRKNYEDQWLRFGRSVEDTAVTATGQ